MQFEAMDAFGEIPNEIDDNGNPGVHFVANAIQFWSVQQLDMGRPNTIADAAHAFGMTERAVREAVESHYWMAIGPNGEIEHEGE